MTARKGAVIAAVVCLASLLGLAATLVAVPIYDKIAYADTVLRVPAGESVDFGGYTITVTAAGEFPGKGLEENQVPVGAALIAAILDFEPSPSIGADETSSCTATLVEPSSDRSWNTLASEREFGYGIAEDSSTTCLLDDELLHYEPVFLTPDGVYREAVIELTLTGDVTTKLWFELPARD